MNFVLIFILLIFLIILLSKTKLGSLFLGMQEKIIYLRNFQMIHSFELIQDWTAKDYPVAIGRSLGSLIKNQIYVAIASKNNKKYLIIKEVGGSPLTFEYRYLYLDQTSIDKLKKILAYFNNNFNL